MPALKWLRLLMNHIPDKYEHLVRYYSYYSNRSPGARRLAEQDDDPAATTIADDSPLLTCEYQGICNQRVAICIKLQQVLVDAIARTVEIELGVISKVYDCFHRGVRRNIDHQRKVVKQ